MIKKLSSEECRKIFRRYKDLKNKQLKPRIKSAISPNEVDLSWEERKEFHKIINELKENCDECLSPAERLELSWHDGNEVINSKHDE